MKEAVPVESASAVIDARIRELSSGPGGETGEGRRSRKCAKSFTRQTLRSSKSESG
jgi:hypothetical protein